MIDAIEKDAHFRFCVACNWERLIEALEDMGKARIIKLGTHIYICFLLVIVAKGITKTLFT